MLCIPRKLAYPVNNNTAAVSRVNMDDFDAMNSQDTYIRSLPDYREKVYCQDLDMSISSMNGQTVKKSGLLAINFTENMAIADSQRYGSL